MSQRHPIFRKYVEKHMAYIPKGFLRFYVLKLLLEKPMSGSEIMNEIEERTEGHWKPSPGSIYPLLAWLKENGLAEEVYVEEGLKRYAITDKGKKLLGEVRESFSLDDGKGKSHFFAFMIPFWLSVYSSKMIEIRSHLKELFEEIFIFKKNMEENFSEEALRELKDALLQFIEKIKSINKKFESNLGD
ncbi:MAG: PadR family transcriptional regulator [Candidatus Njordarchaeia archaeon]